MLTDPIAALATPPGRAALAVIRLSGDGAFDVAARVVPAFQTDPPRTARLAAFVAAEGSPIDRGIYLTFPGPQSYTGEDMVELTCHGGVLTAARLLAALHAAGARPAAPGEFTRRAVLNGKMDLVQAEGVADLVDATAQAQARSALHQLEGGLSRRLTALREQLLGLLASMSYDVDFPEEDDGPLERSMLVVEHETVLAAVEQLLASAPVGERIREGALVVFAGRPNSGKSSLFNALLGSERALVTEIPGTTRDTIEASVDVEGWPVRFADTAGLWAAPESLDQLGIEVSRRYLDAADLVLLCVEEGLELVPDEVRILDDRPSLLVRTKVDLVGSTGQGIGVSIVSGEGLSELKHRMVDRLFTDGSGAYPDLEPMLTRERHLVALARARGALREARPHLVAEGDAVLAAHHVRVAVSALDELVGAVDTDEVFDRVFRRFCVGK